MFFQLFLNVLLLISTITLYFSLISTVTDLQHNFVQSLNRSSRYKQSDTKCWLSSTPLRPTLGICLGTGHTLSQNHIPSSPLASSRARVECRGIWWHTGSPYCTRAEIPEPDSIQKRCHPWPGHAYLCACSQCNKDVNKHCYPHQSLTVISIRQSSDRKSQPVFFPAMPLPLTPAARAWGDFLY